MHLYKKVTIFMRNRYTGDMISQSMKAKCSLMEYIFAKIKMSQEYGCHIYYRS